jgi:hypothetical protein
VVSGVVPEASRRRQRHREEQQRDQREHAHCVNKELLAEVNAIEDAAEALQVEGVHLCNDLEGSQGLEDKVGPLNAAMHMYMSACSVPLDAATCTCQHALSTVVNTPFSRD